MNELMPREKALEYGISSLSNNELLALVIKSAYKDTSVFELADNILKVANGFNNLLSLSYEELISIKGIKTAKALEILAILEISKRLTKIDTISEKQLLNPKAIVEWLRFNVGYSIQEEFFAIYINARGTIIKSEVMYKGSKNSSIVGVDEILRKAIILKASAIVVAHNHPSDDVSPSPNDLDITNKLYNASNMIGIPLLDHLIIGKSNYFSFKNHGMLK